MFSEHYQFQGKDKEKGNAIFIISVIILIAINSSITLANYDDLGVTAAQDTEYSIIFETQTVSTSTTITLNDGGSDTIIESLDANWSESGWMVQSISVLVTYDETSGLDNDCDTVTASMSSSTRRGDGFESEVLEGAVSDCSDIQLNMVWKQPMTNTSSSSMDDVISQIKLGSIPVTVDADISLNVDSTIPTNDDNEQIEIAISFELVKVSALEPITQM
jgi:hypothetical protein